MRSYLLAHALAIWALSSSAQVVKVRDFNISEPQDRLALFAMAVTPAGDVLALVARDTGNWELHRIRDWNVGPIVSDKLLLQGYFSKKDQKDLETGVKAAVFVTKDGNYAICIGEAQWQQRPLMWVPFPLRGPAIKGTAHADNVITVVDLSTFKIVATARTAELGLLEFHQSIKLDSEDRVFIDSGSSGKPEHGAFVRLSVPSLTAGPKCTYARIYDSAQQWRRQVTDANACEASLGGAINLEGYFQREFPRFEWPAVCTGNAAEFCHRAGYFSADGKYGLAQRVDGRERVFFFGWVVTYRSYIVFSSAKRSDIGEIKVPADASAGGLLAYYGGRDYLLVLLGGTRLTFYELQG
jgi:hypothetical protein